VVREPVPAYVQEPITSTVSVSCSGRSSGVAERAQALVRRMAVERAARSAPKVVE
jgi:hypothetical protein